jgi:hypothetical protein
MRRHQERPKSQLGSFHKRRSRAVLSNGSLDTSGEIRCNPDLIGSYAMRSLTPRQNAAVISAQTRWLDWIFSTKPADREHAEEAVRHTYRAGGVREPEIFLWFDDLIEAMLVTEQLSSYLEHNWMLPPESLQRREEVQYRVCNRLGLGTWEQVVKAVGPQHRANRHETRLHRGIKFGVAVPRTDTLQAGLPISLNDSPCDYDVIEQAAVAVGRLGIRSCVEIAQIVQSSAGPGIPGHSGIGYVPCIYDEYRFEQLFRHDCLLSICGDRASVAYDGLRRTVQHAGPWWPFANAAILCDRPRHAHRDSERRLHRENGPAVTFGNGVELFAWHGSWVPAEAILCPETLKHSAISAEGAPQVRQALIEIYGAERYESERRPPPPRKRRNALLIPLPDAEDEKIEVLRSYGPLPYYERYLAGEHRQVWLELNALGVGVRADQYAADARAVAYTTMSRVVKNVVTIIERLREIGYEFDVECGNQDKVIPFGTARWNLLKDTAARERAAPLMPPERRLADMIRLQQDAGTMPISLRTWFEIVGSVTLLGRHPALSPDDGTLRPDPLVIAPFSQVLRAWDASPPKIGAEGQPFMAELAPCPGGQAYSVKLPAPGMDAILENEPQGRSFVDYLRLALQWGGFPGFENARSKPKEVEFLSKGLLPF